MAEELKACGKNGYGETFWKLCVPDEHCSPGLEVGITACERGVTIGGRLIKWTELDAARAQLPSQGGEAVAWQARLNESGDACDTWQTCSKEHHDLVKRCPNEWPGYEVRALYANEFALDSAGSEGYEWIDPVALTSCGLAYDEGWRDGVSEAKRLNNAAKKPLQSPVAQVVGRVHHNSEHAEPVRAVLNSVGRQLPDDTPLYTHPADQVADGVVVSRELLERLASPQSEYALFDAQEELRAMLAKSEGVKK